MIYETLNDVVNHPELYGYVAQRMRSEFEDGPIEIWYAKNPTFMDDFCPAPENLYQSHVKLGSINGRPNDGVNLTEDDLERIFHVMQGEIWSPNGEARNLIRAKGLQHTSMSVGDCVRLGENTWMVARMGWKKIS